MLRAITPRTKVIIVCTPNNPTGDFISDDDLMKIVEVGIPTLIDEAYLEYHPEHESKAPLIQKIQSPHRRPYLFQSLWNGRNPVRICPGG